MHTSRFCTHGRPPKHFCHLLPLQPLSQQIAAHCHPTRHSWPSTTSRCSFFRPAPPQQKVNAGVIKIYWYRCSLGGLRQIHSANMELTSVCPLPPDYWKIYSPQEDTLRRGLLLLQPHFYQESWPSRDNVEIYNIRTRIPAAFPKGLYICFYFKAVFLQLRQRLHFLGFPSIQIYLYMLMFVYSWNIFKILKKNRVVPVLNEPLVINQ